MKLIMFSSCRMKERIKIKFIFISLGGSVYIVAMRGTALSSTVASLVPGRRWAWLFAGDTQRNRSLHASPLKTQPQQWGCSVHRSVKDGGQGPVCVHTFLEVGLFTDQTGKRSDHGVLLPEPEHSHSTERHCFTNVVILTSWLDIFSVRL